MNKKAVFITVGIIINLMIVAAIYVNCQLDRAISSLNKPGVLFAELDIPETNSNESPADGADSINSHSSDYSIPGRNTSGQVNPIVHDVQTRINRPIEKKDLARAGLIILRNLEPEEIRYIYNVGKKEHPSREELIQVRSILVDNLSAEDIAVLRQLGSKYGKSLKILDTSVPVNK